MLSGCDRRELTAEVNRRRAAARADCAGQWTRYDDARVTRTVWRDAGAVKASDVRVAFMGVTSRIGLPHATCPKSLRHLFATCLQDANVDSLIRQELMGHAPDPRNGRGLGMTTVYTHTRDATRRSQLEAAMAMRSATITAAKAWLANRAD